MASNVTNYSQNIDTNFPVQGQDNPSQGFRDNFAQIRLALNTAAEEISTVQTLHSSSNYTLLPATNTILGGVIPDNATTFVDSNGRIRAQTSYVLPVASPIILGGVKIGSNITYSLDGTISVANLSTATTNILGGVKIGTGISITSDGTISATTASQFTLTTATASQLGGVKIGTGVSISQDGTISVTTASQFTLTTATASQLGGVKIGTGVSISQDGTISVTTGSFALQTATSVILGGVKIGTGISITSDGTISATTASQFTLTTATINSLGGVKIGSGVSISQDGTISVTTGSFTLQTATSVILGGVKIGSGISITGDGTISASVSSSLPSRVQVIGTSSSIASGATGNLTIVGYKGYVLYNVGVVSAVGGAWVRIYSDTASRTADSSRSMLVDPTTTGIIAEIVTTSSSTTVPVTPGVIGFNNESPPTSNIELAITNNNGSAGTFAITLTLLPLES